MIERNLAAGEEPGTRITCMAREKPGTRRTGQEKNLALINFENRTCKELK
jgi:hypothetical protein